jgi:hypothetical protein
MLEKDVVFARSMFVKRPGAHELRKTVSDAESPARYRLVL